MGVGESVGPRLGLTACRERWLRHLPTSLSSNRDRLLCGIAGIYIFEDATSSYAEDAEKVVREMTEALAHRGPDGAGEWSDPERGIYLGHRRLAIVDLSESASQPMINDDGSVVIVYNGEIYNAAEVRRELESSGKYRWKTDHSDTEVVLRAYEEWGESCLQRLRGMFAFAIWDGRSRSLWLARDRIGIKPLYYACDGRRLAFASEIKALLHDPHLEREVDEEALYNYLTFFVTPPPKTMFKGISKLEPGSTVRVSGDGEITRTKWWSVLRETRPLIDLKWSEYAELIREELRKTVSIHKVSDVPVGVFLSGGLDSSTNTYFFAEGEPRPVRTFSVGYAGDFDSYRNEYAFARVMAGAVGARHYEIDMTALDFALFLPRMAYQLDEPLGDPVAASIYYLAALARNEGVTVCQVGEGSDELFGGYRSWQALVALDRYGGWLPRPLLAGASVIAGWVYPDETRPASWLSRMANRVPSFWGGAEGFTDAEKRELLSGRSLEASKDLSSWDVVEPYWNEFNDESALRSPLQWMSYLDLSLRIPELLLMRVDKMSMAVGLEARVPFLDHDFVELVMGIPETIRMRHLKRKYLLRAAMRDLLPRQVAIRGKQGFRVPISEWLDTPPFVAFVHDTLGLFAEESGFVASGIPDVAPHWGDKRRVWLLLALALWWNAYFSPEKIEMERWFPEIAGREASETA